MGWSALNTFVQPSPKRSLGQTTDEEKGYKVGANTGPTIPYFSRYQTHCKFTDDEHIEQRESSERIFINPHRRFASRGDSGAVVWDASGQIFVLLMGGQTPQQTNGGYCLVTPIENVFRDIKSVSKGAITNIRVATPLQVPGRDYYDFLIGV
ncbi:Fc.00g012630.m01.CDS01 [Cosmosporella sp. VM-42]